jgi:serine-type D-Ala-D-Ala carboxypeptidase
MRLPRSVLMLIGAAACSRAPLPAPKPLCTGGPCVLDQLAPMLDSALRAGAAPGAVLAVSSHGARYLYSTGRLALDDPRRPDGHTVYDLASLTKVVATTTLALQAVQEGRLELDAPVQRYLPEFRGPGKERVTVRHLLTHSSGLRADSPLWRQTPTADSALRYVLAMTLDTAPAVRMVYSDMGAIVLGRVVERVLGGRLDRLAKSRIFEPLGMSSTRFRPPEAWFPRLAPTEYDTGWRKRIVRGEVHDEKAARMDGVAGHAGLFGSAVDLLSFGEWILAARTDPVVQEFTRRQNVVAGSSRALGWDTPSPNSSAGTRLSEGSFGHTGFTGTSMWIDPSRELVIVLLTNRVHPIRNNPRIGPLRIAVANGVVTLLEGGTRPD